MQRLNISDLLLLAELEVSSGFILIVGVCPWCVCVGGCSGVVGEQGYLLVSCKGSCGYL